ncbi:MAG TPA: tRNA pseudouridine(55) synthase TruB [Dehalococcoidia bacterium]|nr:tRNA pseudouridine(55) synthase TruB [Dehalococcoidia bacterium]
MSRRRKGDSGLTGVLLIDKEPGWTSHDVVARSRRLTGQRRIGHTGALDPMATGLLVLCLGRATRLVEYMMASEKVYEGEIALGRETDTDDAEGEPIRTSEVPQGDIDLSKLAERFTGEIMQTPPAYSAVKVEGRRAYALARKGETPELRPRPVQVSSLRLLRTAPGIIRVDVRCGPGMYVRSLARDIGRAIGCGAHLASLRRTASGPFHVRDAIVVEDIGAFVESDKLDEIVRPADEGVAESAAAILTDGHAEQLRNGQLAWAQGGFLRPANLARLYGVDGSFVGVGEVAEPDRVRAMKVVTDA